MPEKIQRIPRGLLELLSISGGLATRELLEQVRGVVDQLQFYGLQQQRIIAQTSGALAEGANLDVSNTTIGCQYAILFGCSMNAAKTATMTALRLSLLILRNGSTGLPVANDEGGPFGATETGNVGISFFAPYPMLLVPPWTIRGRMDILGTDATASCAVNAEIGVLT